MKGDRSSQKEREINQTGSRQQDAQSLVGRTERARTYSQDK